MKSNISILAPLEYKRVKSQKWMKGLKGAVTRRVARALQQDQPTPMRLDELITIWRHTWWTWNYRKLKRGHFDKESYCWKEELSWKEKIKLKEGWVVLQGAVDGHEQVMQEITGIRVQGNEGVINNNLGSRMDGNNREWTISESPAV